MGLMTSRRALVTALVLGIPAVYLGRKGWLLSADPLGPKDCGPAVEAGRALAQGASELPWISRGGVVNDVSCLSRTPVAGVVGVRTEADIAAALSFARENNLEVSMAGARHSMGGHAFAQGGVVLDMTGYNAITLNEADRTVTVESGARWHDIQIAIHPKYAVKAMQSSDVFTVGGSIAVNAHGMDHQVGAIERTIKQMRVMTADGAVLTCSRTQNTDLYRHVVGGYGLFGVILNVELEITDNAIYRSSRQLIDFSEFPEIFAKDIEPDRNIRLFYGHLSTAPGSFLRETILYSYHGTDVADVTPPPLGEVNMIGLRRLIFNLSKQGHLFHRLKWYAEKTIEPKFESCTISRTDAQTKDEQCLVSRNEPMHDSVPYLFNRLEYETDILHEYFVPRDKIVDFVDEARELMLAHETNLLNASVRVVHREDIALNYAPAQAFSLVLYINQTTDADGNARMRNLTSGLIDLTLKHGGRFFLPYQLHYSQEQLALAYPEISDFWVRKKHYDPEGLFANTWQVKYAL